MVRDGRLTQFEFRHDITGADRFGLRGDQPEDRESRRIAECFEFGDQSDFRIDRERKRNDRCGATAKWARIRVHGKSIHDR